MTHDPRSEQGIYESLRDRLTGKIAGLTNFTETSFNYIWTRALSQQFRKNEVQLTVAQFSGWVDYAGGGLTEDDLEELGIEDDVTLEEIEEFTEDIHLDELVKIVGIERDPGAKASGNVTFTTQSAATDIDEGTQVATQPDSSGQYLTFFTTEDVTSSAGDTTVTIPVEAEEIGAPYNVGSGTVTFLPNPPGGVRGVTNANPVDGGEDRESNEELRERAKNAVFQTSGGGTVEGMIGFIEENTGASEAQIVEFPDGDAVRTYPHGHAVVSGGTEQEVLDAIDSSRPASVEHVLVRPAIITFNVAVSLEGTDIDEPRVVSNVEEYLNELGLNDDFVEDKLIFTIMGSDEDIDNIVSFEYDISDDAFFFDNRKDIYTMQLGEEMVNDGVTEITGTVLNSPYTFVEGTDFEEVDNDGDTSDDSIDWSVGKTSNTTTLTYTAGQTEYLLDQNMIHGGITSVTNTTTATTLTEGTDFDEVDTNGDNLQDGIEFLNAQTGGDTIEVVYDTGNLPDVLTNQTFSETYTSTQERYKVDNAMVDIKEVTGQSNGVSTTFVKGTDYEEWDADGDGRPDGIDWSIGGNNPDDDSVFTVTYDAGTQFLVDYDIDEADVEIGQEERIDAGTITVTIL